MRFLRDKFHRLLCNRHLSICLLACCTKNELFMFLILLCLLASSTLFGAQEPSIPSSTEVKEFTLSQPAAPKTGFYYFRFSTAGTASIHPGLGIGYRRHVGSGAVDLSFNGLGHGENRSVEYMWTAPKLSYLHYMTPKSNRSFYYGGGLGWGGVKRPRKGDQRQEFVGTIPSLNLGYEFLHNTTALGYAEFTVSQPALSVYSAGDFPGPSVEFSLGFGF
jgi:hypothetical protein